MKSKKTLFLFSILGTLVACVSTQPKTTTDNDRAALKPLRDKHIECMARNTATFVDGSNDVAFLVKHIAALCDNALQPVEQYLLKQGFSPIFTNAYVAAIREENSKTTASLILKVKSG